MQPKNELTARQLQDARLHLVAGAKKNPSRSPKRKTLKAIAPCVAALAPQLLFRTRDIDYVGQETGIIASHILVAAIVELRNELRELRRGVIHPVPPPIRRAA